MFGKLLKQIRVSKRFTVTALAGEAKLSRQTIHDLEAGKVEPKHSTICALSSALGVSPSIFFDSDVNHSGHDEVANG